MTSEVKVPCSVNETTRSLHPTPPERRIVERGIKIAGEALVAPGLSLILDGKLGAGALHAIAGLAAATVLGPPGYILLAANSYARSVTGRNLPSALSPPDPRAEPLPRRVRHEMTSGLTLEEIKDGITEDVEDLFSELELERAAQPPGAPSAAAPPARR